MKKFFKWFGISIGALLLIAGLLYAIYIKPFMKEFMATKVVSVDKDLTLVLGGGGNSGILSSDSLVVVIDSKMDDPAKELYETVKKIAGHKPVLVVNTHFHSDHIKGNELFKGSSIIAGAYMNEAWKEEAGEETMPTGWVKDSMVIDLGTEKVTILNLNRKIHTTNDVVVYLHKRKMLFAGDVILNHQVPALNKKHNPDPDGYVASFDLLQKRFDINTVVPGHGDIGGVEVINNFRQYFEDMEIAAKDPSKEDEMIEKYKDWKQVPVIMSAQATIDFMRDRKR